MTEQEASRPEKSTRLKWSWEVRTIHADPHGYQVGVDHQNQSFYGGIESLVLFRDHAVVAFNAEAASVLGGEAGLSVVT